MGRPLPSGPCVDPMSPTLDIVLTAAGFGAVLVGVVMVVGVAPFALMMSDSIGEDSAAIQSYLVIAAVIVPPVVVVAEYITGVALAWRNPGATSYYPWIVLVIAGASWWALTTGIAAWFDSASLRVNPRRSDIVKRYAVRGTICILSASEIVELDGLSLDDRLGWRDRVALTPAGTPRRKRAIPRFLFKAQHRRFTVHAGTGLPTGWTIERSEIASGAYGPGGGIQYVFIAPDGQAPTFGPLMDRGFLEEELS